MEQVADNEVVLAVQSETNSIAIIVKHLAEIWYPVLLIFSSDGEKPWRDRDGEFENEELSRIIFWRFGIRDGIVCSGY
jgi:hypothetical protein